MANVATALQHRMAMVASLPLAPWGILVTLDPLYCLTPVFSGGLVVFFVAFFLVPPVLDLGWHQVLYLAVTSPDLFCNVL